MAELSPIAPEDGQSLVLSAALALAGYRPPVLFSRGKTGGEAYVSGAIPSYVARFASDQDPFASLAAAEHIGWRYLVRIGKDASIADLLADNNQALPELPTFHHDDALAGAIAQAGAAAEQVADGRPEMSYQARLLKLHYAPESWLWMHADGDRHGDADFIVSLDGSATIRSLAETWRFWRNAGIPDTPGEEPDPEGETGG